MANLVVHIWEMKHPRAATEYAVRVVDMDSEGDMAMITFPAYPFTTEKVVAETVAGIFTDWIAKGGKLPKLALNHGGMEKYKVTAAKAGR